MHSFSGNFVLVYWPNEDLVSVVKKNNLVEPLFLNVSKPCKVRIAKKLYDGVVVAICKHSN